MSWLYWYCFDVNLVLVFLGPLAVISDENNPFLIDGESHDLIGVANVFLDALFYDVKLDYYVAVINQQGEVKIYQLHLVPSISCFSEC